MERKCLCFDRFPIHMLYLNLIKLQLVSSTLDLVSILTNFLLFKIYNWKITKQIQSVLLRHANPRRCVVYYIAQHLFGCCTLEKHASSRHLEQNISTPTETSGLNILFLFRLVFTPP